MKRILTQHPPEREGEGAIHASVRKMSGDEAARTAAEILGIYTSVMGGL